MKTQEFTNALLTLAASCTVIIEEIFPDASPGYLNEWSERLSRGGVAEVWGHLDLRHRAKALAVIERLAEERGGY